MVTSLLLASALAVLAQTPATSYTNEPPPLSISLRTYQADGRGGGMSAGDHGTDRFESYVHATADLCAMGGRNDFNGMRPDFGWYFEGRVLGRAGDDLHVRIVWRRLWSEGVRLDDGPQGTLQVTMRPGDRLTLDSVSPPTAGRCQASEVRLEAAVPGSVETIVVRPAPRILQRPGGAAAGGSTGGRSTAAGSQAFRARYVAELWLVHTRPDGVSSTQMQTTAIGSSDRAFGFPPVRISSAAGPVAVLVGGRLGVTPEPDDPRLRVLLERNFEDGDGAALGSGGTAKTIDLPSRGQVVAFELPPPRLHGLDVGNNRFALRLRVSELGGR